MTHAANVISGYVLTAVAVMAYAAWVVRRGRTLGRSLGIGSADDPLGHTRRDGTGGPAAGSGHGDLSGAAATVASPGDQHSGDAVSASP